MLDDPSDQAVASSLFGGEPEVAPGVFLDALERLPGLLGEDAVQPVAHLEDLARFDLDVARGAARASRRLVQQEAGVGEAVAVLARHRDVVDDIFDRVREAVDRTLGGAMGDVNRSLGRLVKAVYRTGWKARDEATRQRLVAILDRVVGEVEGLVS